MSNPALPVVESKNRLDGLVAWIKGNERTILLAAVALQVLFLVSMIVIRATPLLTGNTILLRVQPVDPRDLFRGEYVILGYEFSRMPPNGIEGMPAMNSQREKEWIGRTVYVSLTPEPDGKHYRAQKYSIYQPVEGTYLRGTITSAGRLEFGIESYFVQEGQGRKYEDAVRSGKLSAEVALTADGQAALRRLVIE
jgi:uncharacterized membrane-anchored protein